MNTININGWIDCLILSMSTNVLLLIFMIFWFIITLLYALSESERHISDLISVPFMLVLLIIIINSILPYLIYKNSGIIKLESFADFMIVSFICSCLSLFITINFIAEGRPILGIIIGRYPGERIILFKEILLIICFSLIFIALGALSIWLMYFKFGWAYLIISA